MDGLFIDVLAEAPDRYFFIGQRTGIEHEATVVVRDEDGIKVDDRGSITSSGSSLRLAACRSEYSPPPLPPCPARHLLGGGQEVGGVLRVDFDDGDLTATARDPSGEQVRALVL